MNTQPHINQFRREIYQSLGQRRDAGMELIDALTSAASVESPVTLSESPIFRRCFSSVYDFLRVGRITLRRLRQTLYDQQPEDAEAVAGYEVNAVDCTDEPHPEAETLPDRGQSKKGRYAPTMVGHRYSWLVRLVQERTSWCMPQDVRRVATSTTDSQVGAEQVADLDQRSSRPKVAVADSLYCNVVFLSIFLHLRSVYALVRMHSNQTLYEEPPEREPGQRGRPRKHGRQLKPSAPWREPDRTETVILFGQTVRLQAWQNLHFYKLPALIGAVLAVQFLKADGSPRFKRPLYLFWTGPNSVALVDLCRMYLWRFAIEHAFRFLKQHMGLTSCRSPSLDNHMRWVWCCALAYGQLLLLRQAVADQRPAWHPRMARGRPSPMTPRQVQRQALAFLLPLGTPALPPQPAGKGAGRPGGYRPKPRQRHPVVKKAKKRHKSA